MSTEVRKIDIVFDGGQVKSVHVEIDETGIGTMGFDVFPGEASMALTAGGDLRFKTAILTVVRNKYRAVMAEIQAARTAQATKDAADATARAKINLVITPDDL